MEQAIATFAGICPLCGDEIDLDVPSWRLPGKWRDLLKHRDKWVDAASLFREHRSIEQVSRFLCISDELTVRILDFLCIELCGCRAVTCVSCLDDYRSAL